LNSNTLPFPRLFSLPVLPLGLDRRSQEARAGWRGAGADLKNLPSPLPFPPPEPPLPCSTRGLRREGGSHQKEVSGGKKSKRASRAPPAPPGAERALVAASAEAGEENQPQKSPWAAHRQLFAELGVTRRGGRPPSQKKIPGPDRQGRGSSPYLQKIFYKLLP